MYHNFISFVFLFLGLSSFYFISLSKNILTKTILASIMQSCIILFILSLGFVKGAKIPIKPHNEHQIEATHPVYSNPLPSVLMLTAIVVGLCINSLLFLLCMKVYKTHKTLEEKSLT